MKKAQDDNGVTEKLTNENKLPKYVFVYEDNMLEVGDYRQVFVDIISDRIIRKLNDVSLDEIIENIDKL